MQPAGSSWTSFTRCSAPPPLGTDEERAHYLRLLGEYGQTIGQLANKVRGQKERGIYLPKAQVPNVVGMFEGYRGRLEELFLPAPDRVGDGDGDGGEAFLAQVRETIETGIDRQFGRLIAELGDDYLGAAPEQVGLGGVPGGRDLYLHRVRMHTTTDLSPEEIHEIGLEEVARLEAEMAALREQIGFEASSEENAMKEFLDQVRADPRFVASSPEEVEERYMGYIEKIEPHVADYFEALPEAPYGVRRLDETSEATMTFGVYQLPTAANPRGEYRYNGSDLENRSLFSAQGLIYHELIPGHHFQLALANEREDLPRFRREAIGYSAFTEGWAEYAANLGKEMGMYEDPYDLYGRLGHGDVHRVPVGDRHRHEPPGLGHRARSRVHEPEGRLLRRRGRHRTPALLRRHPRSGACLPHRQPGDPPPAPEGPKTRSATGSTSRPSMPP